MNKRFFKDLKNLLKKAGCIALAVMIVGNGTAVFGDCVPKERIKFQPVKTKTVRLQAKNSSIKDLAPKADSRVLNAFEKMYGKVKVDASVPYSGCFDAGRMTITMKRLNSTLYHEVGHFVEFCSGTPDVKRKIEAAYNEEKFRYRALNKVYVLQDSSEYFAESFKNYCENPGKLKRERPGTYAAVVQAVNSINDSRINTLLSIYGPLWKK